MYRHGDKYTLSLEELEATFSYSCKPRDRQDPFSKRTRTRSQSASEAASEQTDNAASAATALVVDNAPNPDDLLRKKLTTRRSFVRTRTESASSAFSHDPDSPLGIDTTEACNPADDYSTDDPFYVYYALLNAKTIDDLTRLLASESAKKILLSGIDTTEDPDTDRGYRVLVQSPAATALALCRTAASSGDSSKPVKTAVPLLAGSLYDLC